MSAVFTVPRIELREYQLAALDAIRRAADEGALKQLLSLPTGMGKSAIFASLPDYLGLDRFSVVVAVAHTDVLIDQAVAAFSRIIPGAWVDVEKAGRYASPMARIVVGSVQTLKGTRLRDFLRRFAGRIAVLIIDEAHRSTASSYRALVDAVFGEKPDALLPGVTATPRRGDNVGLDSVYERFVYHMDIRVAVDQGYLVPILGYRVETKISLDAVRVARGDYAQDELAAAVDTDVRNALAVRAYRERACGKPTIAFATSVAHAQRLAVRFRDEGFAAAAVWGEMDSVARTGALAGFRSGELAILTCANLLIEGADFPFVECIVMARPTKSGVVYAQALGRGVRPHETIAHQLGPHTTSAERRALIAASPKQSLL